MTYTAIRELLAWASYHELDTQQALAYLLDKRIRKGDTITLEIVNELIDEVAETEAGHKQDIEDESRDTSQDK